jgi:hypothetical protein
MAANSVIVAGRITDGGGHGWPMLAKVTAAGTTVAPVLSNPYTGAYFLTLPPNATYQLQVDPEYPGYQSVNETVTLGARGQVHNVAVPIAPSCTAPGYLASQGATALQQGFDGTTVPTGWTVVNKTAAGGWEFDDPGSRGNLTGGTGGFAIIDSDHLGAGNTEDTSLISPIVNLSAVASPVLEFDSDYRALTSVADVDLSIDGGANWTNLWERADADARGPDHVTIPLPTAAHQTNVQVRYRYTGTWTWWWEIDNVAITLGTPICSPIPGGLVAGQVTDPFTRAGVGGATVTSVDHPSDTTTVAAPQPDPLMNAGFFAMFSSLTGKHQFVAAATPYPNKTLTVNVLPNRVAAAYFWMPAARLSGLPAAVRVTVRKGQTSSFPFKLRNAGGAAATAVIAESPDAPWLTEQHSQVTVPRISAVADPLTFDATGLAPGIYTTVLMVTTADSPYAIPAVPVTMVVR